MTAPLRIAVIGAGRMGSYHARACAESPDVELVAIVDSDAARAQALAAERGGAACASVDQLPKDVAAAVVAVPTVAHLNIAEPLLERGVACLVEKPLATNGREAELLVRAAEKGRAVLQVGHTERFNPAFTPLARFDLKPRFIETERLSPCRFRSMDVGVVMDMMIHDIDLVLSLVRSEVESVDAVGARLLGLTEDMANVRVRFANGCVADMAASRAALKVERRIRIFAEGTYIAVDFNARCGVVIRPGDKLVQIQKDARAQGRFPDVPADADYKGLLDQQEIAIDEHDALRKQLESFVKAVRGEGPVVVTGDDGRRAVVLAERIVEAI